MEGGKVDVAMASREVRRIAARFASGLEERLRMSSRSRKPFRSGAPPVLALSWIEEEDWSIAAGDLVGWLRVLLEEPHDPCPPSGVYVQFAFGTVVYVGQSANLSARLRAYSRRGVKIAKVPVEVSQLLHVERQLLDTLVPPANLDRRTMALRAWRNRSALERAR